MDTHCAEQQGRPVPPPVLQYPFTYPVDHCGKQNAGLDGTLLPAPGETVIFFNKSSHAALKKQKGFFFLVLAENVLSIKVLFLEV